MVREQLTRLAGLDVPVEVEAVPGDEEGLRWRTRQRYVELPDGRRGHAQAPLPRGRARRRVPARGRRRAVVRGARPGALRSPRAGSGRSTRARRRCWSRRCSTCCDRSPGESALDLYAGVGLFAGALPRLGGVRLAGRGRRGRPAGGHARAPQPRRCGRGRRPARWTGCSRRPTTSRSTWWCSTRRARAPGARSSSRSPTAGRGRSAYVACDPAALARDVAIFAEHGYRLAALRAFDLFPMTHHVECVALLARRGLASAPWSWSTSTTSSSTA